MLKSNTTGNKMFNTANKSIFKQDLGRLNPITGPRQTVENKCEKCPKFPTLMRQSGGAG